MKPKGEGGGEDEWLDSVTGLMDLNLSKLWEIVEDKETGVLQSMGSQKGGHPDFTQCLAQSIC